MSEPARTRMTSDEFIAWAMEQSEGRRYELFDGEIIAMSPERLSHTIVKGEIFRRLGNAIEAAKLSCRALTDGATVVVDEHNTYEPDVTVRCGPSLDADTIKITDPIIVVEVLSPSTRAVDIGAKLSGYFRLSSVRHYLVVETRSRTVIHHARQADGTIATRIVRGEAEAITLDPPGIALRDFWD